jgi:hypothetical protein
MKQAQVTQVMNDLLAHELLNSTIPARLACIQIYMWTHEHQNERAHRR